MSFEQVPHELYAIIFDHLPVIDFEAARKVNKNWNKLLGKYIKKHRNNDWFGMNINDSYGEPWLCKLFNPETDECHVINIFDEEEMDNKKTNLLSKVLDKIWKYNIKTLALYTFSELVKEIYDLPFWWLENICDFYFCNMENMDAPMLISRMPKLEVLHLFIETGAVGEANIFAMVSNMRQISKLMIIREYGEVKWKTHGSLDLIIEKSKKTTVGLYEWMFYEWKDDSCHALSVEDIIKLCEQAFFDSKFDLHFTHLRGLEAHLEEWIEENATDCRVKKICGRLDSTEWRYKSRSFTYRNTEFTLDIVNFSEWFLLFLSDDESLFSYLPFKNKELSPGL